MRTHPLIPNLRHARNEAVVIIGLVIAGLEAVLVFLGALDFTTAETLITTGGLALSALIGSARAVGPVTHEREVAAARISDLAEHGDI